MLPFFNSSLLLLPFLFFYPLILSTLPTFAAPTVLRRDGLATLLHYKDYSAFQISDGVGGNALEEARSIFEDPFRDIPLVDVPYDIYEYLLIMWEAIDYASILGYPEAIEIAQSDGDAELEESLLIGEIKNTVLMRMAQVQIFRIKIAKDGRQGKDTEDTEDILSEFEERLMTAVEDDRRNSGRVSSPVPLVYTL